MIQQITGGSAGGASGNAASKLNELINLIGEKCPE